MVTIAQLRTFGVGDRAVATRVERGFLHRLHRGVYAVGNPNPPWEAWMLAAVKASGDGAVLSHLPAAIVLGFLDRDLGVVPEVTVVGGGGRAIPGIRVHRTAGLADCDRRICEGIPVTSPVRTLLDLASRLEGKPLRTAVRRAQGMRLVTARQIVAAIDRLGPRRGSRRLANVITTGPAPTRSVLEDVVLDLLLSGGLAHPDVNKPLMIAGQRIVPDFRWPGPRLIVEADGAAWHDGRIARADDGLRQALLEAHGERVIRVSWSDAVGRPAQTLRRITAAGAPRG